MEIFNGISNLWVFVCFEVLIVLIAMSVDFASGFYKAKVRGETRNSYGLKRTVSKFILYIGSICIACGIDSIFFASGFWGIVHLSALSKVPVVSTIIAVFICVVEMRSIWEKAEAKQKNEAVKTAEMIAALLNSDIIKAAAQAATVQTNKNNSDGCKDYRGKGIQEQQPL
jgi:phage-related holin